MSKKHSKMSLPVQMVIGLVLGVIVGSMTSAEFTAAYLRPFGQLCIPLIRRGSCLWSLPRLLRGPRASMT